MTNTHTYFQESSPSKILQTNYKIYWTMMKEKISSLSSKKTTNCTLCHTLENKYCSRGPETRSTYKKKQAVRNALFTIQDIVKNIDPITKKVIRFKFGLYRNGVILYYDAKVLYKYICTTGDLRDPITRSEYKLHELMRLDRIVKRKFKISENINYLKNAFIIEQERVLLRNHLFEEYTNLFTTLFYKITEDFETFIEFTENIFLPLFIQIRENSYITCSEEEVNTHKKFLKQKMLRYTMSIRTFNINSVEVALNLISKI